jgi:hypothetical protein
LVEGESPILKVLDTGYATDRQAVDGKTSFLKLLGIREEVKGDEMCAVFFLVANGQLDILDLVTDVSDS